jgi:hypothetical protein
MYLVNKNFHDQQTGDNGMKKMFLVLSIAVLAFTWVAIAWASETDPHDGDGNGTDPVNCPDDVTDPSWVSIEPDTLNPKSMGNWITCIMEFPEAYYQAELLRVNSFTLWVDELEIETVTQFAMGDLNRNGLTDFLIKFDRGAVEAALDPGVSVLDVTADISVTCYAGDGYVELPYFVYGADSIFLLDK